MITGFRHGIIRGALQSLDIRQHQKKITLGFTKLSPLIVTIAHGNKNYLKTIGASVSWDVPDNTAAILFLEISPDTGDIRPRVLSPDSIEGHGENRPPIGTTGHIFYDTTDMQQYESTPGGWRPILGVSIARVVNGTVTMMATGSQIGISSGTFNSSPIYVDDSGRTVMVFKPDRLSADLSTQFDYSLLTVMERESLGGLLQNYNLGKVMDGVLAGEDIEWGTPVAIDQSGMLIAASNLGPRCVGICGKTVSEGQPGIVISNGLISIGPDPDFMFTSVFSLFLGDRVLTRTVPSEGIIQKLGYGLDNFLALVSISHPIRITP